MTVRAFVCPKCGEVMAKALGPWAIWYCIADNYQWDVYAPVGNEPSTVEIDEDDLKLHSVWSGWTGRRQRS